MAAQVPKNFRTVITAAAVGNVIEWYDFYIFGSLAAVLAAKFFEKGHPSVALITTVGIFTAGFLIRPLGAFLFGWLGDRIGAAPSACMRSALRHVPGLPARFGRAAIGMRAM